MKNNTVLITPRSLTKAGHPALEKLIEAGFELLMPWPGRQPNERELIDVLPRCIGYLAGVESITAAVLSRCPQLKVISRNGVGLDNVDMEAAEKQGIAVLGTPGANSQGVAELALGLLFSAARSIAWSSAVLKTGSWERKTGIELKGKTLGIIGCGQIGQRLAVMAVGIGMQVIGSDPYQTETLKQLDGFHYGEIDQLAAVADAISLHIPPAGTPLINSRFLAKVKKGLVIINTARAALVDEAALLQAIHHGTVAHYAVDAFASEPPELTELLKHDAVTLTPHIGGLTAESVQRSTEAAVDNLLKQLPKEPHQ
jgi:D-3-phosphoglycerate dehydrogenase / 2-oxoglutarate reductase